MMFEVLGRAGNDVKSKIQESYKKFDLLQTLLAGNQYFCRQMKNLMLCIEV